MKDDEALARTKSVADTAFSIAAVRAAEGGRPPHERLFEDPYARHFLAAGAHAAESTQRFLDLPFFQDGIRLRTRWLDDAVRAGLAAGLDQVVILGAGFDARGLRMPEIARHHATVYEVDVPEQLERKRACLAAAGVELPSHVKHVPIDVDAADYDAEIGNALSAAGFRRGAGAMFVWEGVIGYIDEATIDRSLRFMATAGPGTRVAFTFGEGTFGGLSPAERTKRCGFSTCEHFGSDELWRMYLPGEPHPSAWVAKVGLARV